MHRIFVYVICMAYAHMHGLYVYMHGLCTMFICMAYLCMHGLCIYAHVNVLIQVYAAKVKCRYKLRAYSTFSFRREPKRYVCAYVCTYE
jgi:hypothetical protein